MAGHGKRPAEEPEVTSHLAFPWGSKSSVGSGEGFEWGATSRRVFRKRTDSDFTPQSSIRSDRPMALNLAKARGLIAHHKHSNVRLQAEIIDTQLDREELAKVSEERDIARNQVIDLSARLEALEAAVARLAVTAHADGETPLKQVENVDRRIPKISHSAIGYVAALVFSAVKLHYSIDLRKFDVFDHNLEEKMENSAHLMEQAGKNVADVVDYTILIERVFDE